MSDFPALNRIRRRVSALRLPPIPEAPAPTTERVVAHLAEPLRPAPLDADFESMSRSLCALVYVDEDLRRDIREHFTARRHAAWAPCYAIELVALLRHAARAERLLAARDWCLTGTTLATMATISWLAFGRRLAGPALVVLVLGAGVARWYLHRHELTLWSLVKRYIGHTKGMWRRTLSRCTVACVAVAVLVAVVLSRSTARLCAVAVLTCLAISWAIIVGFAVNSWRLARRVETNPARPRDLAPPTSRALEERAEQVSTGNLFVYARERANLPLGPFVGAGHRLSAWSAPLVDITIGRADDGERVPPQTVDLIELHRWLKTSVDDLGLPKVRCTHQLYVDGASLTDLSVGRLLLHNAPAGPPRSELPEDLVLRRVAEPRPYQRGYLAIQVTDWAGDVVVTMFVRAVLERELLHLEIAVHALPEVRWRRNDHEPDDPGRNALIPAPRGSGKPDGRRERRVTDMAPTPAAALKRGLTTGTRAYWPTLTGAAPRCGRAALQPVVRSVTSWHHQRFTGRGGAFEFGAVTSLREHLAMGQRMHYNAFEDALNHLRRLQHRLMKAFAEYLKSRDIDLAGFSEESAKTIQNVQQYIFNNLNAGAMTFGDNSPATGTVRMPDQSPQPAPSQVGMS